MRNKLFATAKGVISLSWCIAVLFLFVAAAANGTLSASTTPHISAGLQTSPPPLSSSLRGIDGCPPLAGVGGGFSGGLPEHFDSVSGIEPATEQPVGWSGSETQHSNP